MQRAVASRTGMCRLARVGRRHEQSLSFELAKFTTCQRIYISRCKACQEIRACGFTLQQACFPFVKKPRKGVRDQRRIRASMARDSGEPSPHVLTRRANSPGRQLCVLLGFCDCRKSAHNLPGATVHRAAEKERRRRSLRARVEGGAAHIRDKPRGGRLVCRRVSSRLCEIRGYK